MTVQEEAAELDDLLLVSSLQRRMEGVMCISKDLWCVEKLAWKEHQFQIAFTSVSAAFI